ncbi:MAG: peptidylprolyl isomerase [Nitrospinae bacterium]|nr:peptidylprolyl isomerase [Nitrospinota bacterium]
MIRVRASQIFTPSVEDAVSAKKELDAGAEFLQLVEKFSTCPSKKSGGDLGWMNEDSALSLLGDTVSLKDKGKVIGPIHSQYGYHILLIADVQLEEAEAVFSSGTSMQDLNARFPDAHSLLFKTFHIGLPVAGYPPGETVGSVCSAHGKPVETVLAALNSEFANRNVSTISPQDLQARIESGDKNLIVLDIREQWERDIARMEGATSIARENSEAVLGSLGKDREVVLVDWKGDRFPSFQKWLKQRGFSNVKGLEGGIDAWAASVDTSLARYDIDEDDGYRYEDIIEEHDGHTH